jgi:hypothetical protein
MRSARVRARRRLGLAALVVVLAMSWLGTRGGAESAQPGESATGTAPTGVASTDGLQAPLARAVRLAVAAADVDGVELHVTSGWRSAERQTELHREAIDKYGSVELARRWVLPAQESEHVRGGAVDVGPEAGVAWLRSNGVRFGLCQRYANEPWHFERLAGAKGSKCPATEPYP